MLIALLTVVLLGMTAFVTDLGYAYAKQRLLQNAADAAALAVARDIALNAGTDKTCLELESFYSSEELTDMASPEFFANAPVATLETPTVECETLPGLSKSQVVVSVGGDEQTTQFFGGILDVGPPRVGGRARAAVGTALPFGLRPFGICDVDAQRLAQAPESAEGRAPQTVVFPSPSEATKKADGGCGGAAGNAGLLDLDAGGGGRGAGPEGCDEIKGWIECGFDGTLPNPSVIPAQPGGFGGSLTAPTEAITEDEEFALPVYNDVDGSGANATYDVVGFVVVSLCAWDIQMKPSEVADGPTHEFGCHDSDEWEEAAMAAESEWGDNKMAFMQLRYVKALSAAELDGNCSLGDPDCDFGTRSVQLAD